ncbi:Bug family tripartite tricarboxylate transporter substrate binding protein [Granulosicoccus antarcticus]|uniref:Tripartite tricarboxylate transporter family receptor n=1 Tax=Granulosicoccus antarcticus IMCC3135 TaxID=1192854 RepID=A0A2Z2P136_9GAMM|nr:tripartite tricarboxylate transporter substrate binding protein [Granulosicoccus antarcticus]ASJ73274.1 hypothetical protein IMCC3135_15960 [Granulosicoccus antarcticus IMCC3135]
MQRREFLIAAGAATLASSMPSWAQSYPSDPIHLIVPFSPGGPTDSFARLYAESLGKQLGQSVIVENKDGASGSIGSMDVMRSKPDGYNILFGTASTHGLYNLIQNKPRYDAATDFEYIAVLGGAPVALAVNNDMPDTLREFVDASKAAPDTMYYGSPGAGTLLHVATENFLQLSGASVGHVPYKGSAPAMQDLMGGSIEMAVGTLGGLLPLHKGGRLKLLGVASAKRLDLAPEIPTIAESAGLDTPFEALLWNVVAVPRNTPPEIKARLAEASQAAMNDAETAEKLIAQNMFADLHIGDEAASRFVKAEAAKWKPVIDSLGPTIRR